MIELSREQWQAIASEKLSTVIEPKSQAVYVVVPKDDYAKLRQDDADEAEAACVLRVVWIQRMGLDEDEIAESLRDDPPHDIHTEMKQIKAFDNLDTITPPSDVLRKYAIPY